jgi:hypothetical protein
MIEAEVYRQPADIGEDKTDRTRVGSNLLKTRLQDPPILH